MAFYYKQIFYMSKYGRFKTNSFTSATGLEEEQLWLAAKSQTSVILKYIKQLLMVNWIILDVKNLT